MHRTLAQLVLLLTSLTAIPAAFASELTPFRATYAAQFDLGLALDGDAVRELRPLDNGGWILALDAKALAASFHESSRFTLDDQRLKPLNYRYQRKVLGKKRKRHADFDWQQRTITTERTANLPMPADAAVFDKVSYQLQLWRDAIAGAENMSYQVVDGDRIKTYRYRLVGEEQIATPQGEFATLLVERERENSDRETRIWLAKEHPYLVVKLQQVEDDKSYEILLDHLSTTH